MRSRERTALRRVVLCAIAFCLLTLLYPLVWLLVDAPPGKVGPVVMAGLVNSPIMVAQGAYFLVVYFGVHVLAAAVWYGAFLQVSRRAGWSEAEHPQAALLSFLPVLLWLVLFNARTHPASQFTFDVQEALAGGIDLAFIALSAYIVLGIVAGVFLWARAHVGSQIRWVWPRRALPAVAATAVLMGAGFGGYLTLFDDGVGDRLHPDIILIGVDSLRPDHVAYFNGLQPSLTPTIDSLLDDSAVLEYAWTPLARTFAAWVSILTGQYPSTHRAYYNLVHRDGVRDRGSLAHRLAEIDYHRVYAIDEVRFSNMDASYGFDRLVTPAIGAFDFFTGFISDLPAVNVLSNTGAGRVLFPFVHVNRALPVSYRPASFDRRLHDAVRRAPARQPLFVVAHYTLPHWPYRWADSQDFDAVNHPDLVNLSPGEYRKSVAHADAQVAALIDALRAAGRLDNAIVVLLSDHGEAFWLHEPEWTRGSESELDVPRTAYHGSNVSSVAQNRVVLAFAGHGQQRDTFRPGLVGGVTTSLTDIAPTLHELLGITASVEFDGMSLVPLLTERDADSFAGRAVSLETGFSLPSIALGNPDAAEIVEAGALYYDIGRDGRLFIKPEWVDVLRTQKQRAVLSGRWVLAALPADGEGSRHNLLLADLAAHEFWDVAAPYSLPPDAPVALLLAQLCEAFQRDSVFQLFECTDQIAP